ncbi:MAG: DUF917 domain-containing protein [Thermoleophilia bacterium]
MRALAWHEVEDILVGATILGCGGGGGLAYGMDQMRLIYDSGRVVMLAASEEISADTVVACPYAVGAMTAAEVDPYGDRLFAVEHPSVLAVRALGEHIGRDFGALICGELGGSSVADAFYPAAVLGVPIVDADPVGRAVPEVQHSMFAIHGLPVAPFSVVNEIGDTALFTAVADDERAEALIRALAVASRNAVWVADHALPWSNLRDIAVLGTISLAERVGRARREAVEAVQDTADAVAAAAGGAVVFRGTVTSSDWRDAEGFTVGETMIEGSAAWASSTFRVWFKNENLLAWRDGVPDVTCPDLICILDGDGVPVTNPEVVTGSHVSVVAFPAAPQWRTPRGIETLGPSHFGFDVDFVPVEVRHPG